MKAAKTTYNNEYYISKFRGRTTEDQLLKHTTELKEKRSITPDTHKSRTLVKDQEELVNFNLLKGLEFFKKQVSEEESIMLQKEPDNQFYVDEYQYKDNSVIRFGINKYYEGLKEELNIHNLKQIDFSGKKLETLSNISQETKYKEFSSLIQLTTLEQKVLTCALLHFQNIETVKTILIDLFPRGTKPNDKGMINIPKDDEPVDTHTVVLYNTGKKILIIDPNNPQFSAHLANFKPEILEATYTPNNLYKIYSRPEGSKTGFASDKFRDCIDIAVKLAFGLNSDVSSYENLLDLIKSQTVKFITNNFAIDGISSTNKPIRLKQASDFKDIIVCNKKLEAYTTELKEKEAQALKIYKEAQAKIKEQYDFTVRLSQDDYEKELIGLQNEYSKYSGEDVYE